MALSFRVCVSARVTLRKRRTGTQGDLSRGGGDARPYEGALPQGVRSQPRPRRDPHPGDSRKTRQHDDPGRPGFSFVRLPQRQAIHATGRSRSRRTNGPVRSTRGSGWPEGPIRYCDAESGRGRSSARADTDAGLGFMPLSAPRYRRSTMCSPRYSFYSVSSLRGSEAARLEVAPSLEVLSTSGRELVDRDPMASPVLRTSRSARGSRTSARVHPRASRASSIASRSGTRYTRIGRSPSRLSVSRTSGGSSESRTAATRGPHRVHREHDLALEDLGEVGRDRARRPGGRDAQVDSSGPNGGATAATSATPTWPRAR